MFGNGFVDVAALAAFLQCSMSKVRLFIKKNIIQPIGWWARRAGLKPSMWFNLADVETQLEAAAARGRARLVGETWKIVGARA